MSSGLGRSGLLHSGGTYPEFPVEFRLWDGERYGWWTTHQPGKEKRRIATVHGAVNDVRPRILLDTGASLSMISLVLARKTQVKLNRQRQVKVSGLGGIPTQITASAEVKITLGSRVVYIVANIDEGLDVLQGMGFMFRAGVRVCVRESLVQLPDEESLLMYDENVKVPQGVDLPVTSPEKLYLMTGEHAVVRIQYGHTNPEREVVWAGRGDRWVTKIVYQARSWPVAIKVVNVSKRNVWIDMRAPLTRIVQYGSFPQAGRFVRPGTRVYREWQTLILEHAQSEQARLRAERREQTLREREPPCAENGIPMANQDPNHDLLKSESVEGPPCFKVLNRGELVDAGAQTEEGPPIAMNVILVMTILWMVTLADTPPEWTIEFEEPHGGETFAEVHPEQDASGFPPEPASCTPLEKLEMEYERCMRVCAEELDLEPGVYIHEGSEMLAELRDQLVMLPELSELHPECGIDQADVGVPGETSLEDESRMRAILKRHRKIFLGDGNAAPAPA
ncbi:hypothetical protein PHMEG_00017538 [Phytophthora megakarya]|uniref:Peptidase A2 domain-containing protein n=1 Tax=Phytophthora megakarya TaxID=4795 RepID=A0A225VY71_9STRA|nr:hypothetical protein PHMEG_00017538 [Phytophthora megakarya]